MNVNVNAGHNLVDIFKSYNKYEDSMFLDKLEMWIKKNENIDVPVIIDDKFPDILANIDVNFHDMTINFTGIRIGRKLFKELTAKSLAAGFLIELEIYKKHKDNKSLQFFIYQGLSYSFFVTLISVVIGIGTKLLMENKKSGKIFLYIAYGLGILALVDFIVLLLSWKKIRDKEFMLAIKYGLVDDTMEYYRKHTHIIALRQTSTIKLIEKISKLADKYIIDLSTGNNPSHKICDFLKECLKVYKTDDDIQLFDLSVKNFKRYCSTELPEIDMGNVKHLNRVLIEETKD